MHISAPLTFWNQINDKMTKKKKKEKKSQQMSTNKFISCDLQS